MDNYLESFVRNQVLVLVRNWRVQNRKFVWAGY